MIFTSYVFAILLGDATEDMVNTLDSGKDEDQDHEEIYKMANVMSDCEGLTVMLQRLVKCIKIKILVCTRK